MIPKQELTAQQFNNYFFSKPTNIINNNLEINCDLETPTHNNENSDSSTYSIPIVTSDSASKLINGFSVKKAVGSDGLSIKVIKLFKFAILPILVLIMNLSINKCIFPTLWKIAKIKPLFKSGKLKDINNYRPIALLPIFGKVLEKHIQQSLSEYLLHNKLLSNYQFGFKKLIQQLT